MVGVFVGIERTLALCVKVCAVRIIGKLLGGYIIGIKLVLKYT